MYVRSGAISFHFGAPVRGFSIRCKFSCSHQRKKLWKMLWKRERILDYSFRIRISDQVAITFQAST
jgi:hypothetical protein